MTVSLPLAEGECTHRLVELVLPVLKPGVRETRLWILAVVVRAKSTTTVNTEQESGTVYSPSQRNETGVPDLSIASITSQISEI